MLRCKDSEKEGHSCLLLEAVADKYLGWGLTPGPFSNVKAVLGARSETRPGDEAVIVVVVVVLVAVVAVEVVVDEDGVSF
jgi:hypothetical protein